MTAYYFGFFFVIFIVSGLHISSYYSSEKLSLFTPVIFTLLSVGFIFMAKQNLELVDKFANKQEIRFIPREKVFEKRSGKRKMFTGFSGEVLLEQNKIENGFLPNQTYYNLKDEKIIINDTLKAWNLGENDNLILQTEKTKTNNFLITSIIEQILIILLCNSLWFWVFKKAEIEKINPQD